MYCIVHLVFTGYETGDDDSSWTAWHKPDIHLSEPFVDFDVAVESLRARFVRPWSEQGFHEWQDATQDLYSDNPTAFDGNEIRYEIEYLRRELARIVKIGG